MTNSKCIPMYILVHNLNRVLFNTNVHTYTASPVLYYYRLFTVSWSKYSENGRKYSEMIEKQLENGRKCSKNSQKCSKTVGKCSETNKQMK